MTGTLGSPEVRQVLGECEDTLRDLRHRLHRRPSPSGEEGPTAEILREALAELCPEASLEAIGGTGLVASVAGEEEGPTVLLRAELDALPLPETLDVSYGSEVEGYSHKCGHDGHMAQLVGAARLLAAARPPRGRVLLLFQPAEESGEGARRVVQDPLYEELLPDRVFALHNAPGLPLGQVAMRAGPFAAASAALRVRLGGETAHASQAHLGRDPTLAAVHLIQSLPSLPHWELPTGRFADVTLTSASIGGPGFGIAPGKAEVSATFRAAEDEDLEALLRAGETLAEGIARTHSLEISHGRHEEFPAARNDDEASLQILRAVCEDLQVRIRDLPRPFPWSEDFAHLLGRSPGALFALGSGEDHPQLHSREYDYPDALLPAGAALLHGLALASLRHDAPGGASG